MAATIRQAVDEVFNAATIPLTWGIIEPQPGQPRYDVVDEAVEWCAARGIQMRAHALIWHSFWEQPSWQGQLSPAEFLRRSCARAREIMTRYANQFEIVELINEPIQAGHAWRGTAAAIEETVALHAIVRECSPRTKVMINFYDEEETWLARTCPFPPGADAPVAVKTFIERVQAAGVKVDLLGLQRHLPAGLFDTRLAIAQWQKWFGLPVYLTELIIPSSAAKPAFQVHNRPLQPPDRVWQDRPWTEQAQADWMTEFLPFFHALPGVVGATFWEFTDTMNIWHDYLIGHANERYRLPWMAHTGLLRADYSRKPAYEVIRQLAAGWQLRRGDRD
jgi:endo-1,4-beta-xylanase